MEVNQAGSHTLLSTWTILGWGLGCQYNQIVQSPTSQAPVSGSAGYFLFSSSIPSLTLNRHNLATSSPYPYFFSFDILSLFFLYLLRLLSVSVRLLTLFSMLSSLWGSSFKNLTASTSTLSTARILVWRAGNSPNEIHTEKHAWKNCRIIFKLSH